MTKKQFYFYIGTEAELLKVLPVLLEFEKRKFPYKLIFSGQNKIDDSNLFGLLEKKSPDILITKKYLKQSISSYLTWFAWSFYRTWFELRRENKSLTGKKYLIVHGDTLSTLLGAIVGKISGYTVVHIESGYRSHNWLQPFPEEIDRVIVSHFAEYHFYPSPDLLANIKDRRGLKVCTFFNTNIDCLDLGLKNDTHITKKIIGDISKYFIFIMHRQENIMNRKLVDRVLETIDVISQELQCVFIIHKYTSEAVSKYKFRGNVITIDKLPYFDFISLLKHSEFLITDGGGNQEESYYLGKPCLILRRVTERKEGVGENAMISGLDMNAVRKFAKNYRRFVNKRIIPKKSPSKIIVDTLLK